MSKTNIALNNIGSIKYQIKIIAYKPVIDEARKFHIKLLLTKWLNILLVCNVHDIVSVF